MDEPPEEDRVAKPANRPILITDAARSQRDQLRSREIRYVVMMGIRAACLIVGAVLISVEAPLLWLWLPLCLVGMVLIPWLAVLLANDGPPKEEHRFANRMRRRERQEPAPLTLTPDSGQRIIDVEQ